MNYVNILVNEDNDFPQSIMTPFTVPKAEKNLPKASMGVVISTSQALSFLLMTPTIRMGHTMIGYRMFNPWQSSNAVLPPKSSSNLGHLMWSYLNKLAEGCRVATYMS